MDKAKIEESFVKESKGVMIPRSIVIRKKYAITISKRFKKGCVLISRDDYEYLLKLTNEAESARFK